MRWGTAAGRNALGCSSRKQVDCSERVEDESIFEHAQEENILLLSLRILWRVMRGRAQEAAIGRGHSESGQFQRLPEAILSCLPSCLRSFSTGWIRTFKQQIPLTEEEIVDLQERHYDSIAEKQEDVDRKIQRELALQEEKLRLEEEASYAAQREAARAARQRKLLEQEKQRVAQRYHPSSGNYQSAGPEDDFESSLRNMKSQYEVFRSSRLSSDATVLTPNTESSCDLITKTKSTSGNDDSTSLDLEWEDEEGMNRMLPMRERSRTEEDILRAALKYSSKKGSNPTSTSEDFNGLEWENDFVSAEMDHNGNSEYSGFVNPVLELSDSAIKQSDTDQQIR